MSLLDEQVAFLKDTRKLLTFAEAQGYVVTGGELGDQLGPRKHVRREHPTRFTVRALHEQTNCRQIRVE